MSKATTAPKAPVTQYLAKVRATPDTTPPSQSLESFNTASLLDGPPLSLPPLWPSLMIALYFVVTFSHVYKLFP